VCFTRSRTEAPIAISATVVARPSPARIEATTSRVLSPQRPAFAAPQITRVTVEHLDVSMPILVILLLPLHAFFHPRTLAPEVLIRQFWVRPRRTPLRVEQNKVVHSVSTEKELMDQVMIEF